MTGGNYGRIIRKWSVRILLAISILCMLLRFAGSVGERAQESGRWKQTVAAFLNRQMEQNGFLLQSYMESGKQDAGMGAFCDQALCGQFPVIQYYLDYAGKEPEVEDELMAELCREQEGNDEDYKNIEEENLDYGEDALHIENSLLEEMEKENRRQQEAETGEAAGTEDFPSGNETSVFDEAEYPAYSYDWSENWDYEQLVSNFFAVDASTLLKEEYMDINALLKKDMSVDKTGEGPQILIYHTHARESFIDSVEGDSSTTIVGAGERLAELLEERYGFRVMHHQGTYDAEREEAYEKALPAIEKILADNPSIEVVIDLHRDAMSMDRKLVMDLHGRPTARFMFFNGLSYTRKGGEISYLENPYIQENLALSFQAQVAANEYYPGIARKVYLKAYRYNMHLRPKSMLIELGAQNNTVEEIMNACDPLAHILAIVLDEML